MNTELATIKIYKDKKGKLKMDATYEEDEIDVETFVLLMLKYTVGLLETDDVKISMEGK